MTIGRWFRTLEQRYRLRIGKDIADHVDWLTAAEGASGDFEMTLGPSGQVVAFQALPEMPLHNAIVEATDARPIEIDELGEPWIDYLRLASMRWKMRWSFENVASRFTIHLPSELADLGVIPEVSGKVAILAGGSFFEVWKANDYVAHVARLGQDRRTLEDRSEKRLRER